MRRTPLSSSSVNAAASGWSCSRWLLAAAGFFEVLGVEASAAIRRIRDEFQIKKKASNCGHDEEQRGAQKQQPLLEVRKFGGAFRVRDKP